VSHLLFDLPIPAVPIVGEDALYPVRRVFCVARNYASHAREMGGDPSRDPPFYFTKPANALVPGGGDIPYPPATANFHHEVELVVALGAPLFQASAEQAARAIFGHAVGFDLTRRDLQLAARDKSRPWDLGKSFEDSAPISPLVRADAPITQAAIALTVNGEVRQHGDIDDTTCRSTTTSASATSSSPAPRKGLGRWRSATNWSAPSPASASCGRPSSRRSSTCRHPGDPGRRR